MKNIQVNKEMELLAGIGKSIIKYFDYIALFFALPLIFDVPFFDITSFLAIAAVIAIKAISPIISSFVDAKETNQQEVVSDKEDSIQIPTLSVPEIHKPEITGDTIFQSLITNEKKDLIKEGESITIKNKDGDAVVSLDSFRTFRVKKHEIRKLYIALIKAEFTFFLPGKWDLLIKAKKQT